MKTNNQSHPNQPHKFNLVLSAVLILTVLLLWIYDGVAKIGLFSCPNIILYMLLSYGISAASVYLTGYWHIKNTLLRASGALGVLALCLFFLFQNYNKICSEPIHTPPSTSKYMVTLTASDSTIAHADTEDFITVLVQDYKNHIGRVKFNGIGFGESKTDTTDIELESPIVTAEVLLTAKKAGM